MSFFNGRMTALRFHVSGPSVSSHERVGLLERLSANAIGKQRLASADGIESGWIAGADILDTDFKLEKNIVGDKVFFALRIDANKLPGDLMKAYYQADLRALIADNPSGRPSVRQKREANESARDRLEHEAKDGRFLKRKAIECLWDPSKNELLFGATSLTQLDRLSVLFTATFGGKLEPKNATTHAVASVIESVDPRLQLIDATTPSAFVPSFAPADGSDVAWIVDDESRDFLGNEFLLWLWWHIDTNSDEFTLPDASVLTVMPSGVLVLDCPRGQTGNETIRHEVPTRLPEARKAIQAGKLPRRLGVTLVRHDQQYALTLLAESLGIGAAKFPGLEEEGDEARRLERAGQIDFLTDTIDQLYATFCRLRLSAGWGVTLAEMQTWLNQGARAEAA